MLVSNWLLARMQSGGRGLSNIHWKKWYLKNGFRLVFIICLALTLAFVFGDRVSLVITTLAVLNSLCIPSWPWTHSMHNYVWPQICFLKKGIQIHLLSTIHKNEMDLTRALLKALGPSVWSLLCNLHLAKSSTYTCNSPALAPGCPQCLFLLPHLPDSSPVQTEQGLVRT